MAVYNIDLNNINDVIYYFFTDDEHMIGTSSDSVYFKLNFNLDFEDFLYLERADYLLKFNNKNSNQIVTLNLNNNTINFRKTINGKLIINNNHQFWLFSGFSKVYNGTLIFYNIFYRFNSTRYYLMVGSILVNMHVQIHSENTNLTQFCKKIFNSKIKITGEISGIGNDCNYSKVLFVLDDCNLSSEYLFYEIQKLNQVKVIGKLTNAIRFIDLIYNTVTYNYYSCRYLYVDLKSNSTFVFNNFKICNLSNVSFINCIIMLDVSNVYTSGSFSNGYDNIYNRLVASDSDSCILIVSCMSITSSITKEYDDDLIYLYLRKNKDLKMLQSVDEFKNVMGLYSDYM